jgi:hypothetical protein
MSDSDARIPFTEAEREFFTAFVTILTHLQNRLIKAEAELKHLQHELTVRREQVEFFSECGTLRGEK